MTDTPFTVTEAIRNLAIGAPSGVATLGPDAKLVETQIPALAITDVFVVASEPAMLALTAEIGDVAKRSDTNAAFILSSEPASTLSNWVLLNYSAGGDMLAANNLSDLADIPTALTTLGILPVATTGDAADLTVDTVGLGFSQTVNTEADLVMYDLDTAINNLGNGLGSAAALDAGVNPGDVLQLDGSAMLPAVDGSQLTGIATGATSIDELSDATYDTATLLNLGLGVGSCAGFVTGAHNVAVGHQAMTIDNTGNNTAIGYQALSTCTGLGNTGAGYQALAACSGSYNTAIGPISLQGCTGNNNTAIGEACATAVGSGSDNTIVGMGAGPSLQSGSSCTIIGKSADASSAISINEVVIGASAVGAGDNTIQIGNTSATDVYFGNAGAAIIHGDGSVLTNLPSGVTSLDGLSDAKVSTSNLFVGANGGDALTTGVQNVSLGGGALPAVSSGDANSSLGYGAVYNVSTGSYNTGAGAGAGSAVTTGSDNTLLGAAADVTSGAAVNRIAIGRNASAAVDNSIQLGNTSVTKAYLGAGTFQVGTLDPFSRNQVLNNATASIFRGGSWQSDGDAASVLSEGLVLYGNSITAQPISATDGGYARVKPDRFGLFTQDSTLPFYTGTGNYYFRVDPTELYLRDDAGVKSATITRATGNISSVGTVTAVSVTTGNTTNTTAVPWKMGDLVTAATTPDATQYLEIMVNGVMVKLVVAT